MDMILYFAIFCQIPLSITFIIIIDMEPPTLHALIDQTNTFLQKKLTTITCQLTVIVVSFIADVTIE